MPYKASAHIDVTARTRLEEALTSAWETELMAKERDDAKFYSGRAEEQQVESGPLQGKSKVTITTALYEKITMRSSRNSKPVRCYPRHRSRSHRAGI